MKEILKKVSLWFVVITLCLFISIISKMFLGFEINILYGMASVYLWEKLS